MDSFGFVPRARWGKRSLLNRLLKTAQDDLEYRTATLSFYALEDSMMKSLDQLLKWFCETLSYELGLPATIEDHWNETVGCKTSCMRYLQSYVLTEIDQPILIAMDDVDRLFEYPAVAVGFFSLVRGWAEESKTKEVWENFRQIISYSTDVYIDFPTDQSPFNVGRPVTLAGLSAQQVLTLAQQYGGASLAQFGAADAETLLGFVGGTPHLIQLALYHIYEDEIALTDLQSSQRVFMEYLCQSFGELRKEVRGVSYIARGI